MIRIRSWAKWQGEALYDRLRKRAPSGRSKPVTLAYIAISTNLDDQSGNFLAFAEQIGGGIAARGYLLMVLGYVGRNEATTGVIRVSRDMFASIVLTDRTVQTTKAKGVAVYDALINSGIAEEVTPEDVREISPPSSPPPSREASREPSPPSSGRRGEERRREENSPPSPLPGGGFSPAASEQRSSNGTATSGDLRTRLERALTYAINTAPSAEAERAKIVRDRLRKGDVSDHEASTLLAGEFLLAEHDSRNHTAAPTPNPTAQRVIGEALKMLASPRQRAAMGNAMPPS